MSNRSYRGQHRALQTNTGSRAARNSVVAASAAAATIGLFAGTAQTANADTGHNWAGVAQCESSGNWHINTGNDFYGGLQFTESTWLAYGGGNYASRADLATESAQIAVAEKVLAGQDIGAWPVCGRYLTGGSTPNTANQPARQRPAQSSHRSASTQPSRADNDADGDDSRPPARESGAANTGQGSYVVRSGDTLSGIAQAHYIPGGWPALAVLNHATITDPNLIYPNEKIAL